MKNANATIFSTHFPQKISAVIVIIFLTERQMTF